MQIYLNIAEILIAIVLIVVVLLQVKGSALSNFMGGSGSTVYRTKRGLEKTLLYVTIVLVVVLAALAIISLRLSA